MERGRYFVAVVVSAVLLIAGIILSCTLAPDLDYRLLFILLSYIVAAGVANLIWFDGPVMTVCSFGFKIIGVVWSFLFAFLRCGIGIILFLVFLAPIMSVIGAIMGITIGVMLLVSMVMYPINLIRYGLNLE